MKNKFVSIVKLIALMIAMCSMILCMTACGKDVKININDAGVVTEADANTDMTVKEILEKAGVTLGDKDETEPKADEKLGEATEITVKRYAKVTVKNGKEEKTVELVGGKVAEAVEKAGFKLDDVALDAEKDAFLKDGMVITLSEGFEVSLTVDGKTNTCNTHSSTVKDFLAEQKITLGENDEVSPKLEEKIKEGSKITVKRVEYKEEVKKESIDFETEEKQSSSLSSGTTEVTQEGSKGEKEVTYKVKYVDGKEASREKVSEKVTKEPVNKIVTVGTAVASNSDNSSQQTNNNSNSNSNGNSSQSSQTPTPTEGGKQVVSKQAVYDCDGSGHGYYVITYSDGTVEYEEF